MSIMCTDLMHWVRAVTQASPRDQRWWKDVLKAYHFSLFNLHWIHQDSACQLRVFRVPRGSKVQTLCRAERDALGNLEALWVTGHCADAFGTQCQLWGWSSSLYSCGWFEILYAFGRAPMISHRSDTAGQGGLFQLSRLWLLMDEL